MKEKELGRLEATVEHLAQAVVKLEKAIQSIMQSNAMNLQSNATKKDLKEAIEGIKGRYWVMEKLVYGGVGVAVYTLLEKLISKVIV